MQTDYYWSGNDKSNLISCPLLLWYGSLFLGRTIFSGLPTGPAGAVALVILAETKECHARA